MMCQHCCRCIIYHPRSEKKKKLLGHFVYADTNYKSMSMLVQKLLKLFLGLVGSEGSGV